MGPLLLALAGFLLLNIAVGLYRVVKGPLRTDRVLAAQLLGTAGVATLLVLASAAGDAGLRDGALVFALLSTVTTAAFVGHGPAGAGPDSR
jgi:multicomponent Na+:H+ antiporter subunit F